MCSLIREDSNAAFQAATKETQEPVKQGIIKIYKDLLGLTGIPQVQDQMLQLDAEALKKTSQSVKALLKQVKDGKF